MPLCISAPCRDPLQDPLMFLAGGALIPLCKVALFDAIWSDPVFSPNRNPKGINQYFEYFESQCRLTLTKWEKYDLSELKFSHVTMIVKMLKTGTTRPVAEQFLGEIFEGDCRIIASEIIDLTVRLSLMVPIWSFWQGVRPDELALTWVEGTVERAFERHFRPKTSLTKQSLSIADMSTSNPDQLEYGVKQLMIFDKSFTAQRLQELGGIKFTWTDNLLDHLKIRPESNTVCIFHYASFLIYQRKNHIYPAGLVEETLRTLALLLPRSDKDTRDWFLQQQQIHNLDPEAANCRALCRDERTIDKFHFWKEKLINLKHVYDEVKPIQSKSLLRRYFSAINLKS